MAVSLAYRGDHSPHLPGRGTGGMAQGTMPS